MKVLDAVIFPLLLLLLCFVSSGATALKTYNMPSPCKNGRSLNINVDHVHSGTGSSGILRLNSSQPGYDCSVVLKSPRENGITISVEEINIKSPFNTITFKDAYTRKDIDGSYRISRGAAYFSDESEVTITYKAGSNFNYHGGFKLIFTSFQTGFSCESSSLFQCDNGRCIFGDLACDGHNHCGDSSDMDCTSLGTIIGFVFGSLFLVVACACLVIIIQRKRRRNNSARATTVIYPPPINYPLPINHQQPGMVNTTAYSTNHQQPAYPTNHQQPAYPTNHQQPAYPK